MGRRSLQVFDEYRYGERGVLRPGMRFRVRGGPIYRCADGRVMAMYERGVFVFRRYCVLGRSQWIEAAREPDGRLVTLWVGRRIRSPHVPHLVRRPYRIVRVRPVPPRDPQQKGTR